MRDYLCDWSALSEEILSLHGPDAFPDAIKLTVIYVLELLLDRADTEGVFVDHYSIQDEPQTGYIAFLVVNVSVQSLLAIC